MPVLPGVRTSFRCTFAGFSLLISHVERCRFYECQVCIPPENSLFLVADPNVESSEMVSEIHIPENHFNLHHGQVGGRRFLQSTGLWNELEAGFWNLDRMDQCQLPLDGEHTRVDASGVRVYIFDTGIWGTHEDLRDAMAPPEHECHFNSVFNEEGYDDQPPRPLGKPSLASVAHI